MDKERNTDVDVSVEERLRALYSLQLVDSEIDRLKTLRGELPLEVQDLEDDIAGLETRLINSKEELEIIEKEKAARQHGIVEAQSLIKRYEEQQKNVRNNREYDSLSKEIEYQTLEIELCEKKIREAEYQKTEKLAAISESESTLADKRQILEQKKSELDDIINDTQKEEDVLVKKREELSQYIEERLLFAYNRIRNNARNGLAVVTVKRDACGGCFNQIPPQRQLDIKSRKKFIVCEYCGRILVDSEIMDEEKA